MPPHYVLILVVGGGTRHLPTVRYGGTLEPKKAKGTIGLGWVLCGVWRVVSVVSVVGRWLGVCVCGTWLVVVRSERQKAKVECKL